MAFGGGLNALRLRAQGERLFIVVRLVIRA